MRYTRPQITDIVKATDAIQSIGQPASDKNLLSTPDSPQTLPPCTVGAYEADE